MPRIIIKDDQFYIHYNESYLEQDTPVEGNAFTCIVMKEQFIRALNKESSCYSIDTKPKVTKPRNNECHNCSQTKCKMKIRLLLWMKDRPLVMVLSPERLISCHLHKLKLLNSRLSMIATNRVFKIAHGNVIVDIRGFADKKTLVKALQVRTELRGLMNEVVQKNFPEFDR